MNMCDALLVFLSWCDRCSKSAKPCVRITAVTNHFGLATGRFFFFFEKRFFAVVAHEVIVVESETYFFFFFF